MEVWRYIPGSMEHEGTYLIYEGMKEYTWIYEGMKEYTWIYEGMKVYTWIYEDMKIYEGMKI